jgi:hypothetical protein
MICCMDEVRIRVYRIPSSPTSRAIKRVCRWCPSRCYMVIGPEPHCFGMRLKNERFWTRHIARSWETSSHGEREHADYTVKTWELCQPQAKRNVFWSWRLHVPQEVYDVSRNEANSHLGPLVHSRSRRREKKNWRQSFWISFPICLNLEDEIHFKGVGLSHPKISNLGCD